MARTKMPRVSDWTDPEGKFTPAFVRYLDEISRDAGDLNRRLDELFGTDRGTVLVRGETEWLARTPSNAGDILTFDGTDTDFAQPAKQTTAWELIESRAVNGDEDFIDLSGYQAIKAVLRSVTASNAGFRFLRVSINNGSSFLSSSGDYISISTLGVETNVEQVTLSNSDTAARGAVVLIDAFNVSGAHKVVETPHSTGAYLVNTTSPLTALRFFNSNGNLNGGTIDLFGIHA